MKKLQGCWGLGMAVGLAAGVALAGPEWQEGGGTGADAGATQGAAQPVIGIGPVMKIKGSLEGGAGASPGGRGTTADGDFQDLFLIDIVNPDLFVATTIPTLNGFADFDASLFLFRPQGRGVVANLDADVMLPDPLLFPFSNDMSGAFIDQPGLYILAIVGNDSRPLSFVPGAPALAPIFSFNTRDEISGPDGAGGANVLEAWSGPGETGEYEIWLEGVRAIPRDIFGCSDADIAPPFGVLDFNDVIVFLTAFTNGYLLSDYAPPFGALDFNDVMQFLIIFGQGCP